MASSWDSYIADQSYRAVGAYGGGGYDPASYQQPSYSPSYEPDYGYTDYGYDPGYTYEAQPGYQDYAAAPVYEAPAPDYSQQQQPSYQQQADPYAQSGIRQANQQAAFENAAYDANQYASGNAYSTNQMRPGEDFNQMAWSPYLAQQAGPPDPVAPIYTAPGRPAGTPVPDYSQQSAPPTYQAAIAAEAELPTYDFGAALTNSYEAQQYGAGNIYSTGTESAYGPTWGTPNPAPVNDDPLSQALSQGGPETTDPVVAHMGSDEVQDDLAFQATLSDIESRDPLHYNTALQYGEQSSDVPVLGWFGDRASDLGTLASNVQQSAVGQAIGEPLGNIGDTLYGAFDTLRQPTQTPPTDELQTTTAGVEDLFGWVNPETPFLGGVGLTFDQIGTNLSTATNLSEVVSAPITGAIDVPLDWAQGVDGQRAYEIATGAVNHRSMAPGGFYDLPVVGQLFESIPDWAANADDDTKALIASTYEQAELADPGSGALAVRDLYNSQRNLGQQIWSSGASDPLSLVAPGRAAALKGAGLGRAMAQSERPLVRALGPAVEKGFNVGAATLGAADAAADLGFTPALSAAAGVARRTGLSRAVMRPFDLTPQAQGQLDVDTRMDKLRDVRTVFVAEDRPGMGGQPTGESFVPPDNGGGGSGIRSDQFTSANSSRRRDGNWTVIQNNEGEAIITTADQSRTITPNPLTMEQAESVLAELKAGAPEVEAAAWGERLRTGFVPPDADSFIPDPAPVGETRRTAPIDELNGDFVMVWDQRNVEDLTDPNQPIWYWLEDATGQPVIGPDGNPLGRMSEDEALDQIGNLVAARTADFTQTAPAADMPAPPVGREGTATIVDARGNPIDTRQRQVGDAPLPQGRLDQQPTLVDTAGNPLRRVTTQTGEPAITPDLQRTPGGVGDITPGGVRRTVPETAPQQTRPGQEIAPVDAEGITTRLANAQTGQPVELPVIRMDQGPVSAQDATKPQGLYTTIGDASPHADDAGTVRTSGVARPQNPLVVDTIRVEHERFRGAGLSGRGPASAGVSALQQLVPTEEFNRLLRLSKSDLVAELNRQFPGQDYSRYVDSYELLEVYAAQLARQRGHDAILQADGALPEFSEAVILDPSAIRMSSPGTTPDPPTHLTGDPPVPQSVIDAVPDASEGSVLTRDLREFNAAADARRGTEAGIRGRVTSSERLLELIDQNLEGFIARNGDAPSDPRIQRQLTQIVEQRRGMQQQLDDARRELETALSPDANAAPTTGGTTPQGVARQTTPQQAPTTPETVAGPIGNPAFVTIRRGKRSHIEVQQGGGRSRTPNTAEYDAAVRQMQDMTETDYLSDQASVWRGDMYRDAHLRKEPPRQPQPEIRATQDGGFVIVDGRTNTPLGPREYKVNPRYRTRAEAQRRVDVLLEQAAKQQVGYDRYVDLMAHRMRNADDPAAFRAAMENPAYGSNRVKPEVVDDIVQRAGIADTPPASGQATGFTTSKGSTYTITERGGTVRNKSDHTAVGHDASDVGIKPESEYTVYLTPEQANAVSIAQTKGQGHMRIGWIPDGSGRLGVQYVDGPNAGMWLRTSVVDNPSTTPAVGLHPLEVWTSSDGTSGGRHHFGNPIVSVDTPGSNTLDPTANPVNRQGIRATTPGETATSGFARGQQLRDAMARPSNVARTAGQAPTSTERFRGLGLSSDEVDMLSTPMPKAGENKTLGDLFFDATDELDEAVQLANTTTALAKGQQKRLDDLAAKYNTTVDDLRGLDWDGQSLLADGFLERALNDQFMPVRGQPSAFAAKYGPMWSETKQFLRSLALYNWLTVPRYMITNAIGNPVLSVFRPSMWIGQGMLFDRHNWMRVIDRVRSEGTGKVVPDQTAYGNVSRSLGYTPRSGVVGAAAKDQLDHLWGANATGAKGKISRTLMSKRGYLFAQGIDQGWRDIAAMLPAKEQLPQMVREIRRSAKESAQRMGVLVSDAQIDAAIDGLVDAATRNANNAGLPAFSAADLKRALGDLEVRGGPATDTWADRVHRDWRQATSKLMNDMTASADEWAFSFRKTNADEVLSNFVTFHVWASRASKKYVTEALRNPHLLAAYVRATEGLEQMAEDNNWPDSVKGFIQLIDSWGGFAGFVEPNFFLPGMIMAADQAYKEDGEYGLTAVGEVLREVNKILPIIPVWRVATYYSGLEGGGNLPPNPFYMITDAAGAAMNMGNHWLAQAGIRQGQDAGLLPAPFQQAQNSIAHRVSGWFDDLLGDPEWIKQVPLESQAYLEGEYRLRQALADVVAEQNPGMPANEQAKLIDEAMAEPDGDLYQEAYGRTTAVDVVQVGARSVLPLQTRVRNVASDQRAVDKREGTPAEQDAAWDIDNAVRRAGPEDAHFEAAMDEYQAAGDDYAHSLAGTVGRIHDGQIRQTIRVNGRDYFPEQVAAMSKAERFELAEAFLDGITRSTGEDARVRVDTRFDAQNEILAANPDIAAAVEFSKRAEEYGPGVDQFIIDTARINAPYRDFLGTIQAEPGTDEFRDKATNRYAAAQAVQGMARDIFNPIQNDEGAGRVAGLPEEMTLANAHSMRQAEREAQNAEYQAARAEREAEWELGSEYIQDARRDLPKFGSIKQRIDAYDPSGEQWRLYLNRVAGDDDAYLDDALYESLQAEFDGSIWPSGGAEEYMVWADAQPAGTDLSFEAWREADSAAYRAQQDQIAGENVNFDPASLVGGVSQPLAIPGQESTAADPTSLGVPHPEWMPGGELRVAQESRLGYTPNTLALPANLNAVPADGSLAAAIVADAQQYVGSDYILGAKGTDLNGDGVIDFDCSGLIYLMARNAGIDVPPRTYEQWGEAWTGHPGVGRKLDPTEPLVPGDLVFFDTGDMGEQAGLFPYDGQLHAEHVGIYLEGGMIIHAAAPELGVIISPLRDFGSQYIGARRVFAP